MPHNNDNGGNYPEPVNKGYVIPNDNDVEHASVTDNSPAVTITGNEAVSELMLYAIKLLTKNNTFFPSSFNIDRGTDNRVYTDNFAEENILNSSLYSTVIAESNAHKKGEMNLKTLVSAFNTINSQVYSALTYAFSGGQTGEFHSKGDKEIIKGKKGTNATKEFINSIIRNIEPTSSGQGSRNVFLPNETTHTLLRGDNVTTNTDYHDDIVAGYRTEENKGTGAKQIYSSDRGFTTVSVGADWTSDLAEVQAVGTSQAAARGAILGRDWSNVGFDNALINFFGGIAREVQRNPLKAIKFETNNILFHLHNPNVVNVDKDPAGSLIAGTIADFFGVTGNSTTDQVAGPYRKNVTSIYRKTGPSILSLIPDFEAFTFGKGKIFNYAFSLVGGAALTFGEQMIPGTGRTVDSMASDTPVGDLLELIGLDGIAIGRTSEIRDKANLEPGSVIAKIENPKHFKGDATEVSSLVSPTGDGRVFSSVGKNRWQLKNLPDHAILRPGKRVYDIISIKPYTTLDTISPDQVKEMERSLESEYVPFYFHDLRTNEIVSFYAFLRTISEQYTPQWNSEQYYGRVDNVQIYGGSTTRNINLSYTIVALNRIDFDIMWKKVNKLVTLVYPQFGEPITTTDSTIIPFSEIIRGAPVIRMRLGDLFKSNFTNKALLETNENKRFALDNAVTSNAAATGPWPAPKGSWQKLAEAQEKADQNTAIEQILVDFKQAQGKGLAGVLTDLSFDHNTATWETAPNHVAPQLIEVTLSFTAIHDIAPGLDKNGYNRAPLYKPVSDEDDDTIFNNSTGKGTLDSTMRR